MRYRGQVLSQFQRNDLIRVYSAAVGALQRLELRLFDPECVAIDLLNVDFSLFGIPGSKFQARGGVAPRAVSSRVFHYLMSKAQHSD